MNNHLFYAQYFVWILLKNNPNIPIQNILGELKREQLQLQKIENKKIMAYIASLVSLEKKLEQMEFSQKMEYINEFLEKFERSKEITTEFFPWRE